MVTDAGAEVALPTLTRKAITTTVPSLPPTVLRKYGVNVKDVPLMSNCPCWVVIGSAIMDTAPEAPFSWYEKVPDTGAPTWVWYALSTAIGAAAQLTTNRARRRTHAKLVEYSFAMYGTFVCFQ
jgi:hypothetical protein